MPAKYVVLVSVFPSRLFRIVRTHEFVRSPAGAQAKLKHINGDSIHVLYNRFPFLGL